MAMAESNAFISRYSPVDEMELTDGARNVFQDVLVKFSEISNNKAKLEWIIDSGYGNMDSILAAVVKARVDYETRKGGSKVREALVSFLEKVHHYSGIMDVFVSHHPQYTALAYGAIRFLLVGITNHQKHLTQLCNGLSEIGDVLPRAALIMRIYAIPEIREIVVAIYTNVLKFLLRALSWYQENKVRHAIHAITRPPELRYNDILATISSLSQRMTEHASVSSHAEQRDMHTDITALVHWKPKIETKINELTTHLIEVKKYVLAEQAISASARLDVSQKLSDIQLAQLIQHISVFNLPEPIKAFQSSLFISKKRQGRISSRGPPFWLDEKVQRWNDSTESSFIIINGTRRARIHFQHFCTRSIELLRDSNIPVIWALKTIVTDKTTADEVSIIDLLKYLIQQAIYANENIHNDATLAPRLGIYLRAQTEEDWVRVLALALQGIPLIYIVLDIEVLSQSLEISGKSFLLSVFRRLFNELLVRSISTVIRVALVSYGSPLLRGPLGSEDQRFVVTVGSRNQIRRSTARLGFRNRATSTTSGVRSLNLVAVVDSQHARSPGSRLSPQQRRVRRD